MIGKQGRKSTFANIFTDMKFIRLSLFVFALICSLTMRAQTEDSLMIIRSHQYADSLLRAINGRQQAIFSTSGATAPTVTTPVVNSVDSPSGVRVPTQKLLDTIKSQQPPSGSILTSPVQSADTTIPSSSGRIKSLDSARANGAADTINKIRKHRGDGTGAPQGVPAHAGGAPANYGGGAPTGGAPAGAPAGGAAPGGMAAMMQNFKLSIGHIYGKVTEGGQSKKAVSYASVSLYNMKDSLITGQLTEDNGDFSFTDLKAGPYKVKVSFLGYKDVIAKAVVTPAKTDVDVGNIGISPDATSLKEVDVTGQKSTVELKVDRKVFNVGNDISAHGGTGLDVMKNIPSVSIDADGNVTLRNNTPQVYIDGKPTTLTLEQIPADQIDRVEVITNPSAKFEAASSGGIINVVMKRNTKPGYNGMINANIATNTGYNGLALLNLKQKKYGVNLMYTVNGATNRTQGYNNTTTLDANNKPTTDYTNQNINSTFKRLFQVARVGFDFYINNRNTLSVSENAVFGNFNTTDDINIAKNHSDTLTHGTEVNNQLNHFRNFTTDLTFKHTYPKEGKEYTLDIQYNHSNGGGNYLYSISNYYLNGNIVPYDPTNQITAGGQSADMITAQWDISLPIGKNMKIETGVRSNYKHTSSYNNVTNDSTLVDGTTTTPVFNDVLSNNYRIDDLVNAAYITFTHQIKGFSYQLGLRAEEVYYKGTSLLSGSESFSYQYPTDAGSIPKMLFPSFNISQKWGTAHELQFNVARKSNRPNFFQIAPFIFSSTINSAQRGNPSLQPEFINQGEVNYNLALSKVSWLTSVYGRYVQQPITTFTFNDPASDGQPYFISTFNNGAHSISGGWENTIKIFPVKKLDITLSGNVFYTDIVGGGGENNASNSGWSWLAKAIVSYKLPMDFTIQANGTYEAPKILPQGKTTELHYFDLSLSKDFMGFITLNLTVSDVLNSKANGTNIYEASQIESTGYIPGFRQETLRRRDQRYAKLGISIKFGKMDASLFKKKRPAQQDSGGGDMGF
jgi:hypothetical protein